MPDSPADQTPTYTFGAPAPLTPSERARLPDHLRYLDKYRYYADSFDQREAECDAIDQQREWLRAQKCECCGDPATTQDIDGVPLCEGDYDHLFKHAELERVARIHSSENCGNV